MTVRTRILLACLLAAIAPLVVFALGARNEVRARISSQFEDRVAATTAIIRQDLARHATTIDVRLAALAARIDDDPTLRAALLHGADDAGLIDYAAAVMPAAELDHLLLVDADGRVMSSGHFRLEHGRELAALPTLLAADGAVLLYARRPDGAFTALTRAHGFGVAGRRYVLVGGIEVGEAFIRALARDATGALVVSLEHPAGRVVTGGDEPAADVATYRGASVEGGSDTAHQTPDPDADREQIVLPFIDDVTGDTATRDAVWTITHSRAALHAVLRGMDRWFAAGTALATLLALVLARVLAARVNRPLEELARRSTRVLLDRPGNDFATARRDEVGTLSRMLDAMVQRLRGAAAALRDAERRATVGDMARQVNHDIRNGLLPIRNVVRHLSEVAQTHPAELAGVFTERESTLHGGIGYLESLAGNYARLTPPSERQPCDVNAVLRAVVHDAAGNSSARLRLELDDSAPRVLADPVSLRRVVENLVVNAIESLDGNEGDEVVASTRIERDVDAGVVITIADTGHGIPTDALDRVFDDFYTTKARGSGLGLSIVRRLVGDMGGRIHVRSEPGRGTSFHIELPAAP